MEVAAAKALKPSLRTEFIFPQAIYDEILCFNANNVVAGEDFSVDDLLDFSNGEFQVGKDFDDYEEDEDEEKGSTSGSLQSQDRTEDDSNSNSTAGGGGDSVFAGELSVPVSFQFFHKKILQLILRLNTFFPYNLVFFLFFSLYS